MINVDKTNPVWVATLNRPDKANALTEQMLIDLRDTARDAKDASGLILTGEGIAPVIEALAGDDTETIKELREILSDRARLDAGYLKTLMVEAIKRNNSRLALRVAHHVAAVTDEPIFARHIASEAQKAQ